jgi:DNA-binding response OmpR family regulator
MQTQAARTSESDARAGLARERILVVDDEPDILELVGFHLEQAGFEVLTASSGARALEQLRATRPSLAVLDIMLPDLSGSEILRSIRQGESTRSMPVIMLTARSDEVDRVVGFELGADDYVTKPFSPRELVLRVKAVLGRSREPTAESEVLSLGAIQLDVGRHRCAVEGEGVDLTAKEFGLLRRLMTRPGRVFSREQLLSEIWGANVHVTPRTIDTHMKRLREKLAEAGPLISTVRGVGYRIDG